MTALKNVSRSTALLEDSVLVELVRVGVGDYHYVVNCYDPKKDAVLNGPTKLIGSMDLDDMRKFAMEQTRHLSENNTSVWYRVCTEETPWNADMDGPEGVIHVEAREVPDSQADGWPAGDTVMMGCPVCNKTWEMELPQ